MRKEAVPHHVGVIDDVFATDAFYNGGMQNPYTAPVTTSNDDDLARPTHVASSLLEIARRTFLAWEKLRLVFIVILGLLVIVVAGPNLRQAKTLVLIIEGAVVANVCYFAGPIVESYARWLGYQGKWLRRVLFTLGTILVMLLAIASLTGLLLPNPG